MSLWIKCCRQRPFDLEKHPKPRKHEPTSNGSSSATVHQNGQLGGSEIEKPRPIRVATFNAALFSVAPAISARENRARQKWRQGRKEAKLGIDWPKSIIKQSPLHPNLMNNSENQKTQQKFDKSKLRVSVNLPDNEISLLKSRQLSFAEGREVDDSSSSY